jgi:hypothetical protein
MKREKELFLHDKYNIQSNKESVDINQLTSKPTFSIITQTSHNFTLNTYHFYQPFIQFVPLNSPSSTSTTSSFSPLPTPPTSPPPSTSDTLTLN